MMETVTFFYTNFHNSLKPNLSMLSASFVTVQDSLFVIQVEIGGIFQLFSVIVLTE